MRVVANLVKSHFNNEIRSDLIWKYLYIQGLAINAGSDQLLALFAIILKLKIYICLYPLVNMICTFYSIVKSIKYLMC